MSTEEDDVEVIEVELFVTAGAPVILGRTRGFVPRGNFDSWERSFAEYFGVVPNERMAYRVTIRKKETGKLYSVVLVFSGNVVRLGHEVMNGVLVTRAPGI